MQGFSTGRNWVVLVAAALAFALKVALALNTYGTNDVITWERHLAKIKALHLAGLFAPAFLLYWRGTRRRIDFAAAAGAVFLTGSLPYIVQEPALVIHRLFGYDPALVIYRLFGYAPVTATWGCRPP